MELQRSIADLARTGMNALTVRHTSDCAVHNEPAMPAGPCDCATRVPGALESKAYADGTTATGPGPLPEASPAEQSIEDEIQAKGLTAPRVTPADLRANIVHTEIVKHVSPSGQVLRWAVLTTRNGFAVTGRPSASVSSANDNEEIGKKVAIDNAMQELWPLMGYELRSRLAGINDPSKAEQILCEVLSVVQAYMPPDGGTAHEAMGKITGLVDPWPLSNRPAGT